MNLHRDSQQGDIARRAFDLVAAIERVSTLDELQNICKDNFERLGFTVFVGFDSVDAAGNAQVSQMFGQTYEGWEQHYAEHALEKHDPIIKATKVSLDPFFWSDILQGKDLEALEKRVMTDATDFGLRDGFVAPLHNLDGSITSVLLTGREFDPKDPDVRAAAHLLSMYFGATGRRIRRRELLLKERPVQLSQRQIDCLRWVREGKSSSDIGQILQLSHHTVNEHITGACARLGVRTRVQAVAEAAIRGLIEL